MDKGIPSITCNQTFDEMSQKNPSMKQPNKKRSCTGSQDKGQGL